jgi:hypothetical protein
LDAQWESSSAIKAIGKELNEDVSTIEKPVRILIIIPDELTEDIPVLKDSACGTNSD